MWAEPWKKGIWGGKCPRCHADNGLTTGSPRKGVMSPVFFFGKEFSFRETVVRGGKKSWRLGAFWPPTRQLPFLL